MAQLTPIRIEPQLKLEIKELIEEGYFSTITEFVKDSIRKNLENYRKQQAIRALARLKGTVEPKKMTKKDRTKAIREGINSKRNIFKELGLE